VAQACLNWSAEKGEDEGGLLPSYRFSPTISLSTHFKSDLAGFASGRVCFSREFSLNSARITFSEGPFPSKKAFPLMPSGRHFTSFPLIIAKPPMGGRELSFREAVLPLMYRVKEDGLQTTANASAQLQNIALLNRRPILPS